MKADKTQALRLLKTARGQIDGIIRMVEDDRYCVDISNQLMATSSILARVNRDILHAHMKGCVKQAMEDGSQEEKIDELTALLDKLLK